MKLKMECLRFVERVNCYAFGDAIEPKDLAATEEHLRQCAACSELVEFIRAFNAATKGGMPDWEEPGEPCPENALLVEVEAGLVRGKLAEHVCAHVIHCKRCAEKFLMMRGLTEQEETLGMVGRWREEQEQFSNLRARISRGQPRLENEMEAERKKEPEIAPQKVEDREVSKESKSEPRNCRPPN